MNSCAQAICGKGGRANTPTHMTECSLFSIHRRVFKTVDNFPLWSQTWLFIPMCACTPPSWESGTRAGSKHGVRWGVEKPSHGFKGLSLSLLFFSFGIWSKIIVTEYLCHTLPALRDGSRISSDHTLFSWNTSPHGRCQYQFFLIYFFQMHFLMFCF